MPRLETQARQVDGGYLAGAGRDLELPFRLPLVSDGETSELVCEQLLRVLVGKRLVVCGTWKGLPVVAKIFVHPSHGRRHCAREKRGVGALASSGVLTPRLLCHAKVAESRMEVLLFERIANVVDLKFAWDSAGGETERIALLEKAVLLIAAQHGAGLAHDDIHPRNFLLAAGELYTIDGDGVNTKRMGSPLPTKPSLENLARFYSQLSRRGDDLLLDLLPAYATERGWSWKKGCTPPERRRLKRILLRHRELARSHHVGRLYRDSSAFVCQCGWRNCNVYRRDSQNAVLREVLRHPDRCLARARILKKGLASTTGMFEMATERLVLKRYDSRNWWHRLGQSVRESRASVAWRNANLLTFLGVPTPRPVALLEERFGPLRRRAYFVTEYVDGTPAGNYFREAGGIGEEETVALKRIAGILEEMVVQQLRHADLQASSFLVGGGGAWLTGVSALAPISSTRRFQRLFSADLERFRHDWDPCPELKVLFDRCLEPIKVRLGS